MELICGGLFVAAILRFPLSESIAAAYFLWAMLVVFWVDLDHRIIPNEISYPFTILGLFLSPVLSIAPPDPILIIFADALGVIPTPFIQSLMGMLIGGSIVMMIRIAGQQIYRQEAMGLGDVKLLALIGAWLGVTGAMTALFAGALLGGIISIVLLVAKRVGRRSYIPFGPFLVLGAVYALFEGRL